jgi:hypothetical protein
MQMMKRNKLHSPFQLRFAVLAGLGLFLFLFLECSPDIASGTSGSETGNGKIIGCVVDTTGNHLSNVQVQMLPSTYDPKKSQDSVLLDTTDNSGNYSFDCHWGSYTIQTVKLQDRKRSYSDQVNITIDETTLHTDTVKSPGSIIITLPESTSLNKGYFYIPGTTIYSSIDKNTGSVVLDSVPAACISAICYAEINSDVIRVIGNNIRVFADSNSMIRFLEWLYSQPVYLNTSSTGVQISKEVTNFPLLLHFSEQNFPFEQASSNGTDLFFTNSRGVPLTYEIEQWSSAERVAAVWVNIDTLLANSDSQHIFIFWGNPSTHEISNGAMVFDTAKGFQGVWHFNDKSLNDTGITIDVTQYRNNGMWSGKKISSVAGLIGNALSFGGISVNDESFVKLPAAPTLDYHGMLTISCWVRLNQNCPDSFNITGKYSFSEGQSGSYITKGYSLFCSSRRTIQLRVGVGAGFYYVENGYKIDDNDWHYIVGMFEPGVMHLFVDDTKWDWNLPETPVPSPAEGFIGGKMVYDGTLPFAGEIDEVRICDTVYSADWVRLNYYNQKFTDTLVRWK